MNWAYSTLERFHESSSIAISDKIFVVNILRVTFPTICDILENFPLKKLLYRTQFVHMFAYSNAKRVLDIQ